MSASSPRAKGRFIAMRRLCPKCGAVPGQPCQGQRGDRKANHKERRSATVTAAEAAPVAKPASKRVQRKGFYWSDEWRRVRYRVLRASRGMCECCGAMPDKGKPLHVDHIKPRSRFPDLELDPGNLQVLCDDCNIGKGASDQIDWRGQRGLSL